MAHKSTKRVLQLVEPPEKTKGDRSHSKETGHQHSERHSQSQSPPTMYSADPSVHGNEQIELVQQFENVNIGDSQPQLQAEEQAVEQIRWGTYYHPLSTVY